MRPVACIHRQAPVTVPVLIRLRAVAPDVEGRSIRAVTPCLLPELYLVHSITVCGPRYDSHTLLVDGNGSSTTGGCGQGHAISGSEGPGFAGTSDIPRRAGTAADCSSPSAASAFAKRALHPLIVFVQRRAGQLRYEDDPAGHARLMEGRLADSHDVPPTATTDQVAPAFAEVVSSAAETVPLDVLLDDA